MNNGEMKITGNYKADKEKMEHFLAKLNRFIQYLQEKPESRSVEYLAEEKHPVKCCYRCGYVYEGGNICPKCGRRNKDLKGVTNVSKNIYNDPQKIRCAKRPDVCSVTGRRRRKRTARLCEG